MYRSFYALPIGRKNKKQKYKANFLKQENFKLLRCSALKIFALCSIKKQDFNTLF